MRQGSTTDESIDNVLSRLEKTIKRVHDGNNHHSIIATNSSLSEYRDDGSVRREPEEECRDERECDADRHHRGHHRRLVSLKDNKIDLKSQANQVQALRNKLPKKPLGSSGTKSLVRDAQFVQSFNSRDQVETKVHKNVIKKKIPTIQSLNRSGTKQSLAKNTPDKNESSHRVVNTGSSKLKTQDDGQVNTSRQAAAPKKSLAKKKIPTIQSLTSTKPPVTELVFVKTPDDKKSTSVSASRTVQWLKKTANKPKDAGVQALVSTNKNDKPSQTNDTKQGRSTEPNSIIWRAYDSTHSFSTIISGVIATQALIRMYLAIQRVEPVMKEERIRLLVGKRISGALERIHCDSEVNVCLDELSVCQSLVKRYTSKVRMPRQDILEVLVTSIQSNWRARAARNNFVANGGKMEQCSLLLTWSVEVKRQKMEAATKISANVRRLQCQRVYRRAIQDIILCQSIARAFNSRKAFKGLSCQRRVAAAAVIQAKSRSCLARRRFVQTKIRVIMAQSVVRRWRGLKSYIGMRKASIKIEATWRGYTQHKSFRRIVKGIIKCQSVLRYCLARKKVKQLRHEREMAAATLIQSKWRCHVQLRSFKQARSNMIKAQAAAAFRRQTAAVTCIATVWRRYYCMKKYPTLLEEHKHECRMAAATIINARIQGFLQQRRYLKAKSRVILVQSLVRKWKAKKHIAEVREVARRIREAWQRSIQQAAFRKAIKDITVCQSIARGYLSKKKLQQLRIEHRTAMATLIQTHFRSHAQQKYYNQERSKIIQVQACVRMSQAVSLYSKQKAAATVIATAWRRHHCLQAYKRKLAQIQQERRIAAAKLIYTTLKTFIFRWRFVRTIARVIVLQSLLRRWRCRKCCAEARKSVVKIESVGRGYIQRTSYRRVIKDVIICQSVSRCLSARKKAELLRHERRIAVTIVIQSQQRAMVQQKHYLQVRSRIISLQAFIRMIQGARYFSKHKNAVTTISKTWRGHHGLETYTKTIKSIIICQSVARRKSAMNEAANLRYDIQMAAATRIQSILRTHVAYKNFSHTKAGVVFIQSVFHVWMAKAKLRRHKMAATKISTSWRRYQCARTFAKAKLAATKISACLRCYHCFLAYQQIVKNVILCQSVTRRKSAIKEVSLSRHNKHMASATLIQARWRAFVTLKAFHETKSRVILIQSIFHRWVAQRYLFEHKEAVSMISARYRSYKAVWMYALLKRAAVKISSCWRRCQSRMQAATRLQAQWRSFAASEWFTLVKHKVILLQSTNRKWMAQKMLNQHKSAATKVSSQWRVYFCRRHFLNIMCKITLIQSVIRRHIVRRSTHRILKDAVISNSQIVRSSYAYAATSIIYQYKTLRCKKAYERIIRDVILCQTVVRKFFALKKLELLRHEHRVICSTIIQARWRCFAEKRSFMNTVHQITLIQSLGRRRLAEKYMGQIISEMIISQSDVMSKSSMQAVTRITSQWRGYKSLVAYRHMTRAAIGCQTIHRRILAKRKVEFLRREVSATAITKQWRSFAAKKNLTHTLHRVMLLQATTRRWQAMSRLRECKWATTTLTACWRKYYQQIKFKQIVLDVTKCQSVVRSVLATRHLNQLRKVASSIKIQAQFRAFAVTTKFQSARSSTIAIQSSWRRLVAVNQFLLIQHKVIMVQARVRRWKAMNDLRECKQGSTCIVAYWRRYHQRLLFKQLVADVITCQAVVRSIIAIREVSQLRHGRRVASSTKIQSRWRAYIATKELKHAVASSVSIQARWRSYIAMERFTQVRHDVILVQSRARRWHAMRRLRECKQSSTCIVAAWRRYHAMTQLKCALTSSISIQAAWRSHVVTQRFLHMKQRAILVQARARGWQAMKNFRRCKRCSTRIVAFWRRHHWQSLFKKIVADVLLCQSVVRTWSAARYLSKHKCAVTNITKSWRSFYCRMIYKQTVRDIITYQSVIRRHLARKELNSLRHEHHMAWATVIQAKWRSFSTKKLFLSTILKVILAQSVARRWMARNHSVQKMRDIIVCQSVARRKSAFEKYKSLVSAYFIEQQWVTFLDGKTLVQTRPHVSFIKTIPGAWLKLKGVASIKIQAQWRRSQCLVKYKNTLKSTIVIQVLAREYVAMRKAERKRCTAAAISIQANWRAYFVARRVFKALERMRLDAAATVIQTRWRAFVEYENFLEIRYDIILVQSIFRMNQAIKHRNKLESELIKAGTYHAHDFFEFMKKRNAASDKIQAVLRKKLVARSSAAKKIQSIYRGYVSRMDYVISKYISVYAIMRIQATYRSYSARKKSSIVESCGKFQGDGQVQPSSNESCCQSLSSQSVTDRSTLSTNFLVQHLQLPCFSPFYCAEVVNHLSCQDS